MKTLLIGLIVLTLGVSGQAKDLIFFRSKAKVVTHYLSVNYPNAKGIHQKKITDSLYHVHFIHNDREFFIDITTSGVVTFKEKEMLYNEIPKSIKEYLNKEFQFNQESQYKYGLTVELKEGRILYFVEIQEGNGIGEYLFDSKGNVLMRDFI